MGDNTYDNIEMRLLAERLQVPDGFQRPTAIVLGPNGEPFALTLPEDWATQGRLELNGMSFEAANIRITKLDTASADNVVVIGNPDTDAVSTLGSLQARVRKYCEAVLATNGKPLEWKPLQMEMRNVQIDLDALNRRPVGFTPAAQLGRKERRKAERAERKRRNRRK